ncbi:hypothetical protein KC19_12G072700 [Ceratodon purpureus]|uniref:Uncharacterized protein n=1 Tax=Ceratodon purpureus TaxID=3225 RepID=A0A8T0G6V2_CERPU|nr:hypothetical protein KC19_12G072700 [Ceratodon purpureus]
MVAYATHHQYVKSPMNKSECKFELHVRDYNGDLRYINCQNIILRCYPIFPIKKIDSPERKGLRKESHYP